MATRAGRVGAWPGQRSRPAVAHWALQQEGVDEVFAVARPSNTRGAATAKRMGMEWVGETDKYYGLRLHVYRLRAADVDKPLPGQAPVAHSS